MPDYRNMPKHQPKPVDILVFSTTYGHKSLAEAAIDATKPKKISSHILIQKHAVILLYKFFYIHKPSLVRHLYRLVNKTWFISLGSVILDFAYLDLTEELLQKYQPKIVISTNLVFNSSLDGLKEKYNFKYINILCDPRTFVHGGLSFHADTNCIFDKHQAKDIKKIYPKMKVTAIGWLVKQAFEKPFDKVEVRKELGLYQDKVTLLFASGYQGTHAIINNIKSLLTINKPVQLVVACGKNTKMLRQVNRLAKSVVNQDKVNLIGISFTNEMHRYMQAADLVIGKAGPNTVFEAVATHTPFFATTHIAGLEDGNLNLIHEYKLGYVEENPVKASAKLVDIVYSPKQLDAFQPHLKKMANYNHQSKQKLLKIIHQYLSK